MWVCEIKPKMRWNSSNGRRPTSVDFLWKLSQMYKNYGNANAIFLKLDKNMRYLGDAMRTLSSWSFQKCNGFLCSDILNQSYCKFLRKTQKANHQKSGFWGAKSLFPAIVSLNMASIIYIIEPRDAKNTTMASAQSFVADFWVYDPYWLTQPLAL